MRKILSYWLPPILWAVVIFSFSSLPTIKASQFFWKDFLIKKSAHVFEYAIFTILLYRALKAYGMTQKNAAVSAIFMALLYGISDEIHQTFTPGREPRIRDVFFDTIGSLLGIYSLWRLLPKAPKKLKKWANALHLP